MKRKLTLLCAALITGAGFAYAATTQTVTFTVTVPSVLDLTTTSNAVAINLTASSYAGSDAITTEALAAHQLAVRSNRAWVVSAKSNTTSFAFTPAITGDTRTKPSTDLSVRKAAGAYQSLTTTNFTLATGTAGGVTNVGNTFAVDYKVATDIKLDPPGSYALDVVYTLTAP
ncbi:MAG: hypothetical protein H0X34_09570 [Chthoniobacterales bacterium]|nr:hypothetical protein [Chthoniobacterales bacterium]